MSKFKEVREKKTNIRFLRDSAKLVYVHASKQIALDDSTIQALQA